MDSLLRWSIEHSTPRNADAPPPVRNDIPSDIIDHILGPPDAVLMKDALKTALDLNMDESARINALGDLETLVEQIDNANDLAKLKMWDPLLSLLTSQDSSDGIKVHTLWVIGIAVQNNPSAQNSCLDLKPVPIVLSFLSPTIQSAQLRSKAAYTLSGLCKHNSRAVEQLGVSGGWEALSAALEDSDTTVRRKVAFLLNTLLIPSDSELPDHPDKIQTPSSASTPVHPNSHASMISDPSSTTTSQFTVKALEDHGLLRALVKALTAPYHKDGGSEGDVDFEENVVRTLLTYLTVRDGKFPHGLIDDADLGVLKTFMIQHQDLSERCGAAVTGHEMLLNAVEGVQVDK